MNSETFLSVMELATAPTPPLAYIGPGAGLGAIATLIAITLGVLLLIVGFVWYPLKRFLKRKKTSGENQACRKAGDP